MFARVVGAVARHPLPVLAVTLLLALGGAGLALRLEPSVGTETLVDRGSETFEATQRFRDDFGDEAVLVLVRGELTRTVLTEDLGRVLALEGCLSGNVPDNKKGLGNLPPVCREIAELDAAKVVFGPATFINTSVNLIGAELAGRQRANQRQAQAAAEAARKLSKRRGDPPAEQERLASAAFSAVTAQFTQQVFQTALRFGITGIPRLDDPDFVSRLVFASGEVGVPKSRFAYLFPSENAAMITIRLKPGLSDAQRRRGDRPVPGGHRAEGLSPAQRGELRRDRRAGRGRSPGRRRAELDLRAAGSGAAADGGHTGARFPLAPAAAAAGACTGRGGHDVRRPLAGGREPHDGLDRGAACADRPRGGLRDPVPGQVRRAAPARARPGPRRGSVGAAASGRVRRGERRRADDPHGGHRHSGRLPGAAAVAGADGARLRHLLVLGIGLALACAIGAGFAALVRLGGAADRSAPTAAPRTRERLAAVRRHPRVESGREWLANRSWRTLGLALSRPNRVLAVGLVVAVAGLALDTQSEVVSDVRELVPQDLQALEDVDVLQEETGVSGEIDVTVRADDITDPAVIAWMTRFQDGVLRAHGYRPGKRCTQERDPPELCPALSLPDLFNSGTGQQADARQLLDAVPPYFSQGVVTADRKTANLAFGIRLMALDRQKRVVDDIKERLDPPEGVQASVVGLPVLAAEANSALSSPWRRGLTLLVALAGVFLVLLLVRRSVRDAAVPLIPIALATGWSGGILFVLGLLPGPLEVDLNPMSVTLGALVIAISTEFSVLLSSRYRQEREAGAGPARAIELTYASTGAAVLASGATAIAGFAALIASDIRMLRDFGIVTVVDLSVSLLGVMIVLPAALMWAEQHGGFSLGDLDPRPRLRALRPTRDAAR